MPDPIFVLGAPRSGTTLLRVMLAGHPQLFSPPEMVIAPFATMAERKAKLTERFWEKGGLRRALMDLFAISVDEAKAREAALDDRTVPEVYALLQAALGERVLVDKCPHLAASPASMDRLAKWFPAARWIWIVRHPGSVTRSVENMPMAEVMLQGYADDARELWYHCNHHVVDFLATIPAGRKTTIRYEDLVADPAATWGRSCREIALPFDEALLHPYDGDRMREGPPGARAVGDPNMAGRGAIDPSLATKWLEGFDPASVSPATHALARELGYDLGAMEAPPMAAVTAALGALLDTARRLESEIKVPADLDMVEGRRFLLRMVSASVDLFVEEGDADRPRFHHAEGPTRKMFADNPDADYWRAPIRLGDGRRYRVSGQLPPGTTYAGFLLYRKGGRVGARLRDVDLVDADGRFDFVVGADPESTLRGEGDETAVMVRQYFCDRATEAPIELSIEFLGTPGPDTVEPRRLARSLDLARRNLEAVFKRTIETHAMASRGALNRFLSLGGEDLFPTPDNAYQACWYRFGADQVMFVRGRLPTARYFSACLYNAWLESLEYRGHVVCMNHRRIRADADGRFELCLAHEPVRHDNCLDTTGHHAGYLVLRALLPEGAIETPTIEVRYRREVDL
jgi:hypothetical protein